MRALLIAAHGSPYPEANEDITRVAEVVRHRAAYDLVELAYLDVNEPTIPAALDHLVAHGATSIVFVPYLLHTGRHTLIDIPKILDEARSRHTSVQIHLGAYLGSQRSELARVLADRARS